MIVTPEKKRAAYWLRRAAKAELLDRRVELYSRGLELKLQKGQPLRKRK
jgi:hypothetical protein